MARLGTLAGGLLFGTSLVLLTACGGGGDGAGSGAGAAETPVVYAGSTNPAVISGTNASKLAADVLAGDESASVITGIAIEASTAAPRQAGGQLHVAWRVSRALQGAAHGTGQSGRVAAGLQIDETEPCDGGNGSSRTVGTLNDGTLTGTLTITFINCLSGTDVLNGRVMHRVDVFHGGGPGWPRDSTLSFTRLTIRGPGLNVDATGSVRIEQDGPAIKETVTGNAVTLNNATGETIRSENLRFAYSYNAWFSPSSILVAVDGRLFDPVHGYVDIMTSTPLHYGSWDQVFPDVGQVLLTGAAGASIRADALSATLVMLGLDVDGDGGYESAATLKWSELSGPVGADVGDRDGDGMHNGWETANDLNPDDAADALLDPDADGATTLQEYYAGTDPRDAGSRASDVGLSITMQDAPDPATVGNILWYSVVVTNFGASAATDVVVTDALPPSVTLHSVSTEQGSCTGTTTLTCDLGTVAAFDTVAILILVVPTTDGALSNTVTVASTSFDGDLGNNSVTSNTTVNPGVASLRVSVSDSPDPVVLGATLTYTITVSNPSFDAAGNVVVAGTLSSAVSLVSVTPSQGDCSGATSLTCNLGAVPRSSHATISIAVSTVAEGVISFTAFVTSSTFDPDPSDNAATSVTTVGQPAAGIQALIDGAASGETILVPAGTYFGSLNFKGKNVVLQSVSGPALTTISVNGGTAVEIGPGGTFKGFTVTGAVETFGAGMKVHGAGSTISGNVFVGNTQSAGGFGAAIGGNSASPVIERNVFRNNSCDNQFHAAVVAFVNSSSPVIANNVFENNPCRAISLSLPEGQAPLVVNNTIVGNRTGIYSLRQVSQSTHTYRNNILFQNGIGLEMVFGIDAYNPAWENNLLFGNTTDYKGMASQAGVNGNISADPMFVDAAAGNYHLQSGSPAIDTGNAAGAPSIDIEGTARPQNGVVDIGAFEALP